MTPFVKLLCGENQTIDQLLFMLDYPDIVHCGASHLGLDMPFVSFVIKKEEEMINSTKRGALYLPLLLDNKLMAKG